MKEREGEKEMNVCERERYEFEALISVSARSRIFWRDLTLF